MQEIAVIGAIVLAYSLVSGRLTGAIITGPMLFVAAGILVGPEALDWANLRADSKTIELIAEVTLAIILFNDAALIDWRTLRRNRAVPLRLLGIGLPLTIVLGAIAVGLLVDGVEFWQAALVGVILAPTDAALGQAVVTNPKVPLRIRQSLSVESGLNDGIAAPLVTFFIAASGIAGEVGSDASWLIYVGKQIGFGLLIGVGMGLAGAVIIGRQTQMGWISHTYEQIAVVAVPVVAFSFASLADGNGFIAAFIAGIAFGNVARHMHVRVFEFSERSAAVLLLVTFVIFGGAMAGPALSDLTWQIALYATLSLVLIRPLAVAVSMIGSGFQPSTVGFLAGSGLAASRPSSLRCK